MGRIRVGIVALAVSLAVLGGSFAGGSSGLAQDEVTIDIVDFAFEPGSVEIPVGTTVTWTNQDSAPHTATADSGAFDTGQLMQGQSGSVTFDAAGSFPYFCAVHPNMRGTITVR